MTDHIVVIPARYASSRLPGKPLREIAGKPMLQHVWERGIESGAAEVIVATDDQRVADAVESFGGTAVMTSTSHRSGTERLAEVCEKYSWPDDQVIVNLQGDEPLMPPQLIGECAALLDDSSAEMGTLASSITRAETLGNPNAVKVLIDENADAIYFSRAPIPYSRQQTTDQLAWNTALLHHGIYAYRVRTLRRLVTADQSAAELCEQLEQLRALHLGIKIRVGQPEMRPGPGVDTEEDLENAARLMAQILNQR